MGQDGHFLSVLLGERLLLALCLVPVWSPLVIELRTEKGEVRYPRRHCPAFLQLYRQSDAKILPCKCRQKCVL